MLTIARIGDKPVLIDAGSLTNHDAAENRRFATHRDATSPASCILHIDGAADARRKLMQLVRQHEIDPFDEPINCRVEELSE